MLIIAETDPFADAGFSRLWHIMAMVSAAPRQPLLRTARDAADLLRGYFDGRREKLVVAHVDAARTLLRITEVEGCAVEVALPIRTIIGDALAAEADGFILAHNHPSGNPEPSAADREATRTLAAVAAPLGLTLHDHLVFGGAECRSMRGLGLL